MPMIEVSVTPGALTPEARDKLVEDLSAALIRAERAPDNAVVRAITWAWVDDQRAFYVGGAPADDGARIRVAITTPEGALSDRRRAELAENASRVAAEAIGASPEDPTRVWITMHEIADGSWGAGGRIYRFADIAALAAAGEKAGVG
jgi:phenylpyruvate tautomerase PptA (4-oxalocrotonate tautomerase family)